MQKSWRYVRATLFVTEETLVPMRVPRTTLLVLSFLALPAVYTNENIAASINQTYLRSVVYRVEVNIALSSYLVGSVAELTASSIFRVNVGMRFTHITAVAFYP